VAIRVRRADSLLSVLEDIFKPWWAVSAAGEWAPTREVEFVSPPEGFWADGGWWAAVDGETKGMRAMEGRWTRKETRSQLGTSSEVAVVVLPSGVTAVGGDAFSSYRALVSVTLPEKCLTIGNFAFDGCTSLVTATIRPSTTTIGKGAFDGCASLASVTIAGQIGIAAVHDAWGFSHTVRCSQAEKGECRESAPLRGQGRLE
jgi:hypothetical protein